MTRRSRWPTGTEWTTADSGTITLSSSRSSLRVERMPRVSHVGCTRMPGESIATGHSNSRGPPSASGSRAVAEKSVAMAELVAKIFRPVSRYPPSVRRAMVAASVMRLAIPRSAVSEAHTRLPSAARRSSPASRVVPGAPPHARPLTERRDVHGQRQRRRPVPLCNPLQDLDNLGKASAQPTQLLGHRDSQNAGRGEIGVVVVRERGVLVMRGGALRERLREPVGLGEDLRTPVAGHGRHVQDSGGLSKAGVRASVATLARFPGRICAVSRRMTDQPSGRG
jgi:hypothetical protein